MQGRALIASVTLFAFTTLVVWPQGAAAQRRRARDGAPPAAPARRPASDDATMAQAKQHFEAGRNAYNAGDYVTRHPRVQGGRGAASVGDPGLQHRPRQREARQAARRREVLQALPGAAAQRDQHAEVEGKIASLEQEIAAQPPPAASSQPGGTAPQPGAGQAQEQPGDMPPADPHATAGGRSPARVMTRTRRRRRRARRW